MTQVEVPVLCTGQGVRSIGGQIRESRLGWGPAGGLAWQVRWAGSFCVQQG